MRRLPRPNELLVASAAMAIRDKLSSNAQQYLHDGESIEAVFVAQAKSPWWVLVSFWIIIVTKAYRGVVVTDRRILVCQSSRFNSSKIEGVIRELPRSTRIGPTKGLWYKCDNLGDALWIARVFHKDVEKADSLIRD